MVIFVPLILIAAGATASAVEHASGAASPHPIALVRVLTAPKRFVGKNIVTRGYLRLQRQDVMSAHLCPSMADCENLTPAAVVVNDSAGIWKHAEQFDRTFVEVEGTIVFAPQNAGFVFTATKCRFWSDLDTRAKRLRSQ
jgi:hypothetical protein